MTTVVPDIVIRNKKRSLLCTPHLQWSEFKTVIILAVKKTQNIGAAFVCSSEHSDKAPCFLHATTSRRAPNWSSEEAHLESTILNQQYRDRVSTDQPNRENSQLAVSLEGESGPTFAGNTLPHPYPKTRFQRESARGSRTTAQQQLTTYP